MKTRSHLCSRAELTPRDMWNTSHLPRRFPISLALESVRKLNTAAVIPDRSMDFDAIIRWESLISSSGGAAHIAPRGDIHRQPCLTGRIEEYS